MARPRKNPDLAATRDRILDAAVREFGEKGYSAARLEDIGSKIGIRRASLFHYFKGKKVLYEEAVKRAFRGLKASLFRVYSSENAGGRRIEQLARAYQKFAASEPSIQRLILRELLDPEGEGYRILLREAMPMLVGVEKYLRLKERSRLRDPASLRQALLTWLLATTVKTSMGTKGLAVWGREDHGLSLAAALAYK